MYDHITPLLRIFGRVPLVLRIDPDLALASRSLCRVTVSSGSVLSFLPHLALFPSFWCTELLVVLQMRQTFHAVSLNRLPTHDIWSVPPHVPCLQLPSATPSKTQNSASYNLESLHLILPNYVLCFSSIIVYHHCVALLFLCSFLLSRMFWVWLGK